MTPPFDPTTFWRDDDVVGMLRGQVLEDLARKTIEDVTTSALDGEAAAIEFLLTHGWTLQDINRFLARLGHLPVRVPRRVLIRKDRTDDTGFPWHYTVEWEPRRQDAMDYGSLETFEKALGAALYALQHPDEF